MRPGPRPSPAWAGCLRAGWPPWSSHLAGPAAGPASGVDAVLVNITALSPTAAGSLLAFKHGDVRPPTSDINFAAGQSVANELAVPISADGKIDIYNPTGSTNV